MSIERIRTLIIIAAIAGGAAFAWLWWFGKYEPDPSRYPMRGIDVSHHQGAIDWRAVARDDVAFAYIKASEGRDFVMHGLMASRALSIST